MIELLNDDWNYILSDRYLPEKPFFREKHVETLRRYIERSYYDNIPSTILLEGPTGTGKTMTFRIVEKELRKSEKPDLKIIYINGRDKTVLEVVVQILYSLGIFAPRKGFSLGTYLTMIESTLKDDHLHVCIDEVDRVGTRGVYSVESLLYFLSRSENISCTIITNDFMFLSRINDPRVRSSITRDRTIIFERYTGEQCFEILRDRCEKVFKKEVISEEDLKKIAEFIARETGDIRDGIYVLRRSIDSALKKNKNKITFEDILEAWKEIEIDKIGYKIRTLPESLRIVLVAMYLLIREIGKADLESKDIYNKILEIREILGRPGISHQKVRNQLLELEVYGLIEKTVEGRGRGSGVGRKYRLVFTSIPDALKDDVILYPIIKKEQERILKERLSAWKKYNDK